jgi:hypothetical protein
MLIFFLGRHLAFGALSAGLLLHLFCRPGKGDNLSIDRD